jgi:glutamate synthase (NADPH/NADH) large chain
VVEPRDDGRRRRRSTSTTPASWSPGTARPRSRSPTARRSAPSSTATACVRRATTSPRTTSSSWRPRRACWTSPENVLRKGRLQPGRMFLVDTEAGPHRRGRGDQAAGRQRAPYRQWLKEHLVQAGQDLPERPRCRAGPRHAAAAAASPSATPSRTSASSWRRWRATASRPSARWATTRRSRCCRTSRGCCSTTSSSCSPRSRTRRSTASARNRHLGRCRLGSEGNLLEPEPTDCRRIELKGPVLTNEEFAKLRAWSCRGLQVGVLDALFRAARGEKGLEKRDGRSLREAGRGA